MTLPLGAIQLAVVSLIVAPLSIVAVALRLWSRYLQNTRLAIHDYLAIAALLLAEACVSIFLAGK